MIDRTDPGLVRRTENIMAILPGEHTDAEWNAATALAVVLMENSHILRRCFPGEIDSTLPDALEDAISDYLHFGGNKGFDSKKGIKESFSKAIGNLFSFGLYASNRDQTLTERLNRAGYQKKPEHIVIKALLNDDNTGDDLLSFRYFLASYILGVKAETDFEAKFLIAAGRYDLGKSEHEHTEEDHRVAPPFRGLMK